MTYTTSELLERAKNLADCGNTDFLTYKEAVQYLNDAYNDCYQIAINRGDDSFVKTFAAGAGATPLPYDFYALRSVKSTSGYVYKRKSLDAPIGEPGYNIINDKIILNGGTAIVTYYPKPKFLTLSIPEERYDYKDPRNIGDINDDYFAYPVIDSEGQYTVVLYNLKDDNETIVPVGTNVEHMTLGKSSMFLVNDEGITDEYDFEGNMLDSYGPEYVPVKYRNGLVKMHLYNDGVLTIENTEYPLEFEDDCSLSERPLIINGLDHLYYVDTNKNLYEYNKESKEATLIDTKVDDLKILYKSVDNEDGLLYFNGAPMIFSRAFEKAIQTIDADFSEFYGWNSKYMIYGDGVYLYSKGNMPDVMMNYPSAQYYTLIAYTIALNLVAKQQGDISILSAQKEKALEDYYNDVSDAFNVTRITNIYGV